MARFFSSLRACRALVAAFLGALALSCGGGIGTGAALAAEPAPQALGTFGYWRAYLIEGGASPVCYMALTAQPPAKPVAKPTSSPQKGQAPKKTPPRRGPIVLMISHRPAEGAVDVFSYNAGIRFRPASDVAVTAGGKSFNLFTQADTAWARDSATDRGLAVAIRGTDSLILRGQALSGASIADKVQLKGADAAYRAIGKACGVAVAEIAAPSAPPAAKTPAKKAKGTKTLVKTKKEPERK